MRFPINVPTKTELAINATWLCVRFHSIPAQIEINDNKDTSYTVNIILKKRKARKGRKRKDMRREEKERKEWLTIESAQKHIPQTNNKR